MSHNIFRVRKSDSRREKYETNDFVLLDEVESTQPKLQKKSALPSPVLYVPEGFEPNRYLAPERHRLGDKARYLLHTIHTQSIFNQRHRNAGVHLNAKYLRAIMGRHYRAIIADLESEVIEIDRIARDGVSNRFRFTEAYRSVKVRRFEPTDNYLIRKLIRHREERLTLPKCPTRRYLSKQLRRVTVEFEDARRVLSSLQLDGERLVANESCLERLAEKEWFFKPDRFGRVHHNITCLKRELRACLRVNGKVLVETDISNSQPLFCGLTYFLWEKNQSSFSQLWTDEAFDSALGLKEENLEQLIFLKQQLQQITTNTNQTTLPLRCAGFEGTINDALKYLLVCEAGKIYEYMAESLGVDISDGNARSVFKKRVYTELFYARWRDFNNPLIQAFRSEFPSIFEMIRQVNYRDHRRLAQWMQRVEARLVIDCVVKKFARDRPDAFVLTIHDSVLTKKEDAEYAQNLILQEFGQFAVHPTLKQK